MRHIWIGPVFFLFLALAGCAVPELAIEPQSLQMLVSLDGEEDEYYEELILMADGQVIDGRKARWRSDDQKVATVDRFGWVTSRGVGETFVTAAYRGARVSCRVEVKRKITSDTPESACTEEP